MRNPLLYAALLLATSSAFSAPAPDSLVVTGPNNQQVPIGQTLITPTNGTQGNLADITGQASASASLGFAVGASTVLPVSGGTGYTNTDTVTLACKGVTFTTAPVVAVSHVTATVVDAVSLLINGVATKGVPANCTFTQASTTGSGTGLTVSGSFGPIAANLSVADLTSGGGNTNGNFFLGAATPSGTLTGAENMFIGFQAGSQFTGQAVANTAIGSGACGLAGVVTPTTGSFNTCLGDGAGRNLSGSAAGNTLVGQGSGRVVGGTANTIVGGAAAVTLSTGSHNTIIGNTAGGTTIGGTAFTSDNNTLVGFGAGVALTSGASNTLIGTQVGNSLTTGGGNVIIGAGNLCDSTAGGGNQLILCGVAGAIITSLGTAVPSTSNTTIAGFLIPTGGVKPAGGFTVGPRTIHACGIGGNSATSAFTNQTPVSTEFYVAEIFVPANMTVTGVSVFNGSVASGNVKVGLANTSGVNVATSASTAVSGTNAYQNVSFTGTYAAVGPANYLIEVFYDNNTVRANAFTVGGGCGTGKATAQTFATGFTTIAYPTTFTTAIGPVAGLF